jgi:2-iminobutanoate/2-iminopropanoate deaminase
MKKIIKTSNAPDPVGPYNQAVVHNYTLYVSGQIAIDPATGKLVLDDIEKETTRVMDNHKAILTEAGLTFNDVLKCTIFVSDMGNYEKINGVYSKYFNDDTAPARELVEVSKLPKGVNIEISLIAAFA